MIEAVLVTLGPPGCVPWAGQDWAGKTNSISALRFGIQQPHISTLCSRALVFPVYTSSAAERKVSWLSVEHSSLLLWIRAKEGHGVDTSKRWGLLTPGPAETLRSPGEPLHSNERSPDHPMVSSSASPSSSHKGDPIQPPGQAIRLWEPKEQNASYWIGDLNLALAELFKDGINL